MNEPNTPTPDLENAPVPKWEPGQTPSNAQISHSVNPASQQAGAPVAQATPQQPAPPAQSSNRRARSVLIIEDERFISELYTRALQKQGYRVETQTDGQVALDMARTGRYDIILLDIMLPSMNGIDLLHALKDKSTPGGTVPSKIIITTNMDQPDQRKARIERLADGYLIKAEITPKELVNYLSQI